MILAFAEIYMHASIWPFQFESVIIIQLLFYRVYCCFFLDIADNVNKKLTTVYQ